jgi:pSer/pThr/pTyr-binding forkhead associated (FHA) protein
MIMTDDPNIPKQFPLVAAAAPKLSLSVMRGPGEGRREALRRVLSLIGSRSGCKICLNHKGVAPVHAAIVNTGSGVFLRDLVTDAKTYLNDLPVECERLDDGDVIKIAQWEFVVQIDKGPSTPDSDATGMINLEPAQTIAVQPADNGQLVKLRREVSVIGRRPGCDVRLQAGHVSRAHALVATVMGVPTVFDLLSTQGLSLNGEPIHCAPVESGNLLHVGASAVRIVVPGSGSAAPKDVEPSGDSDIETTVIRLDEPEDQIDIRAAEIDPRLLG